MCRRPLTLASLVPAAALLLALPLLDRAAAQPQPGPHISSEPPRHVVRPETVPATDERVRSLRAADGFRVDKFAEGLGNVRMMVVAEDGTVYVSRRQSGDVLALNDRDGDGRAESVRNVFQMPQAHGLAIHDGKLYVVAIHEIVAARIKPDGTLGEPERILDGLPDGGQHPNRTIGFGPDGMMYVTVGSLSNAADEPEQMTATVLRCAPDGSSRAIFARGLRNTLGFGWHPKTGQMWGMDHGTDWLGDDVPPEELNRIEEGKHYGWPFLWGDNQPNPIRDPGMTGRGTYEQWQQKATPPVLGYTAHAAPMQMAFYTGEQFPQEYRNDAFVAMRGSWNRQPPSGYEVVRIRFNEAGQPTAMESFVRGWLTEGRHFGRLCGLAVARDGSLLVGDDTNGVIYRIRYDGGGQVKQRISFDRVEP